MTSGASGLRFVAGDLFEFDNRPFQIVEVLDGGTLVLLNQTTQRRQIASQKELLLRWLEGRLLGARHGPNVRARPGAPPGALSTEYDFADFTALPPHLQHIARVRRDAVAPLALLAPSERTDAVLARVGEELAREHPDCLRNSQPPSRATLRRWLKIYLQTGGDPRALVPAFARRGPQDTRMDPVARELLRVALGVTLAQPERFEIADTEAKLRVLIDGRNAQELARWHMQQEGRRPPAPPIVPMPSRWTITRAIKRMYPDPRGAAQPPSRRQTFRQRQVGAGPHQTRPLERVEADHTPLPILLIDEDDWLPIGYPVLTGLRDCYTGYVIGVGMAFEKPSYLSVQDTMAFAITPKDFVQEMFGTAHPYLPYGVCEQLALDNAPEFRGNDLSDACFQLGVEIDWAPIDAGWWKGGIERFHATLKDDLVYVTPGSAFGTLAARRDYQPAQQACMTLGRYWELLVRWIVDVDAQEPHRGLGRLGLGGVPAELWLEAVESGVFAPRLPPQHSDLLALIGRVEMRTVQPSGIEFEYLWYQASKLASLRTQLERHREPGERMVRIKYDPGDIGHIWVLDPFAQRYLKIPARDDEYARGMTLWKHRTVVHYVLRTLKARVEASALARAKVEIHEQVAEQYSRVRPGRSRVREARWLGLRVRDLLPDETHIEPRIASSAGTEVTISTFSGIAPAAGTAQADAMSPLLNADLLGRALPTPLPEVVVLDAPEPSATQTVARTPALALPRSAVERTTREIEEFAALESDDEGGEEDFQITVTYER